MVHGDKIPGEVPPEDDQPKMSRISLTFKSDVSEVDLAPGAVPHGQELFMRSDNYSYLRAEDRIKAQKHIL